MAKDGNEMYGNLAVAMYGVSDEIRHRWQVASLKLIVKIFQSHTLLNKHQ